jgi:TRAP-type C4-dicarboxylate transport system permease small subunit
MNRVSVAYIHLLNFLKNCSGAIIFGVFVLIVSDVLIRLAGLKPWLYSSVLVEYGLLWFTMLAAPWLARHKAHVFIDAVTLLLPDSARHLLEKLVYFVCVSISLVIAAYSSALLFTAIDQGQIDNRAVDMPLWTLYAPIPLCFLLVAIEFLRFLLGFDSMYGKRSDIREGT